MNKVLVATVVFSANKSTKYQISAECRDCLTNTETRWISQPTLLHSDTRQHSASSPMSRCSFPACAQCSSLSKIRPLPLDHFWANARVSCVQRHCLLHHVSQTRTTYWEKEEIVIEPVRSNEPNFALQLLPMAGDCHNLCPYILREGDSSMTHKSGRIWRWEDEAVASEKPNCTLSEKIILLI